MRRKDREMPEEFALQIVDKCVFATLGTSNNDGAPYCVPVSIAREGMSVYFHCAMSGQKTDNMRRRPDVCLACVGETRVPEGKFSVEYESAVIFGRASEVLGETEKIRALRLISMRHTPGNMEGFEDELRVNLGRTAVWRVDIASVTGKRLKYGPDGGELKG